MAYCTQSDVERKAGGQDRLVALADWDGDGIADAQVITDAIAEVSSLIDSYAGKKRAVAFPDPVPAIVRWTCAVEVVFALKNARETVTDPAQLALHEERLAWLKALAAGEVSLGVDPEPAAPSHGGAEYGERTSDDEPNVRADYVGVV